jgi:hypothetical protein
MGRSGALVAVGASVQTRCGRLLKVVADPLAKEEPAMKLTTLRPAVAARLAASVVQRCEYLTCLAERIR